MGHNPAEKKHKRDRIIKRMAIIGVVYIFLSFVFDDKLKLVPKEGLGDSLIQFLHVSVWIGRINIIGLLFFIITILWYMKTKSVKSAAYHAAALVMMFIICVAALIVESIRFFYYKFGFAVIAELAEAIFWLVFFSYWFITERQTINALLKRGSELYKTYNLENR